MANLFYNDMGKFVSTSIFITFPVIKVILKLWKRMKKMGILEENWRGERERCYIQIIFDENRSKPHPQNRRQGEESIYFPKKKMGSKGIKEMISSRGITIHNHSFP